MTNPHDQPVSRRAARRARQEELAGAEASAPPVNAHVTSAQSASAQSASAQVAGDRRPRSHSSTGAPSSAPSDMTYRTEVRPRVPLYDEPAAHTVAPSVEFAPPVAPPAVAPHSGERVRRRDFRPPPASSEQLPSFRTTAAVDAPLDTTRPDGSAPEHAQSPTSPPRTAGIGQTTQPPVEHTMSRRALRERRAAGSEADGAPDAASAPILIEPIAVMPAQGATDAVQYHRVESHRVEPHRVESTVEETISIVSAPVDVVPTGTPVEPTATGSHWSVGIHDDDDPFENTFSREVGSAVSLNTNALVLPEMPARSIAGPVDGTGEIIVTGMITMSHVVSSTGTLPTVHDSPDFDDVLDADDRELSAPDSAPVSALKAISSHTAAHTVMTGKRSSSNTVTTVLVASTVVMAVVAIGLFVVAVANGLF